jgi:hypothetical protein
MVGYPFYFQLFLMQNCIVKFEALDARNKMFIVLREYIRGLLQEFSQCSYLS